DSVPLRLAGGARPDGAHRGNEAPRALEWLGARAVHEREHEARLGRGAAGLAECFEQGLRGPGPVGVRALPVVAQLRHRSLLTLRHEDRVVAEALGAARLVGDPALEHTGAPSLAARAERDELADVARP